MYCLNEQTNIQIKGQQEVKRDSGLITGQLTFCQCIVTNGCRIDMGILEGTFCLFGF